MWGWWLVGCGRGPSDAVRAAKAALDADDREAFGRVVDVDAVIPEIGAACGAFVLVSNLSDQELGRAPDLGDGFVGTLTRAVLGSSGLADQHLKTFEQEFPVLPVDRCPLLILDVEHLTTTWEDREHAVVSWPVEVSGHRGEWRVSTVRRDDGWHVAHADGGPLIEAFRTQELAEAAAEARRLIDGLPAGAPHDDWEASRAWLRRHPEARAEAAAWEAAEAPLIGAPGALPARDVAFFQPRGWLRNRHAGATVTNPGPKTVERASVRFGFVDGDGAQVTAGDLESVVVEVGPLPPHGELLAAAPAPRGTWGEAARPVATVIAVTWADGTSWRHPAVEAGRWSPFPTR